ncbi:MAG: hypothetical protein PHN89_03920 [Candidatus Pacebacteria bacterium]|nr:hypothetical protein [Candidatus Paceibacterota bacterium]
MIYNATVEEIRSWTVVDGWSVAPNGTKIIIGNYVELGDDVELGDRVKLGDDEKIAATDMFLYTKIYYYIVLHNEIAQIGCYVKPVTEWLAMAEAQGLALGLPVEYHTAVRNLLKEYGKFYDAMKQSEGENK